LAALQREHFELGVGEVAVERRHPTLALHLDLKPGESETISATFTGATGPIKFVPPVMVNDPQVVTSSAC
ncbi:MAG: hypothetical protein RL670_338, partial [Actinomycetota bacterium]